jgi:hypothetical protein
MNQGECHDTPPTPRRSTRVTAGEEEEETC